MTSHFASKINKSKTEMTIFRDGHPVYRLGINPASSHYDIGCIYDDTVNRLKTQII